METDAGDGVEAAELASWLPAAAATEADGASDGAADGAAVAPKRKEERRGSRVPEAPEGARAVVGLGRAGAASAGSGGVRARDGAGPGSDAAGLRSAAREGGGEEAGPEEPPAERRSGDFSEAEISTERRSTPATTAGAGACATKAAREAANSASSARIRSVMARSASAMTGAGRRKEKAES